MSEAIKKVSIITVNFNQPKVTEQLLASIKACDAGLPLQVIVVDNGSAVDPTPGWKEKYKDIDFIRSDINIGFAGGNNIGIRAATGDLLFLVNNDTEFTPGLVDSMVKVFEDHPGTGMASPKIRYFDAPDTLQYAGYTPMDFFTARNSCVGEFEKDNGQWDNVTGPTAYVHGAAMMVSVEAIAKAGMMKENYFLYYEELDWCERIRRAGFGIRVNMQALIYHKESVSVGQKSALKEYFMNRNRILFERRNAPLFPRLVFFIYFALVVAPRNLLQYAREKRRGFARQLGRAIWWNLTHDTESTETGFKP